MNLHFLQTKSKYKKIPMTPNPITLTTYQHQNIHLLIASKQNDNDAKLFTIAHIDAHIDTGETGSSTEQPKRLRIR